METEPDKKLSDLKDRLDAGEYAVDPQAVADAILRRSRDAALLRSELAGASSLKLSAGPSGGWPRSAGRRPQTVCSNPANRLVASRKLTPAVPRMTRPIQVIRSAASAWMTAASSSWRALGGAHTHSS
jgi:hypothetical protein